MPLGWVGSWGPDVAAWAQRELGITLDRWQRRAINRALLYGADGRLLHRTYLISTGRQNGKTALVRALIGWALTAPHGPDWSLILGLAHDRAQARIPYKAVMADLAPVRRRLGPTARGGLRITTYLGIRSALYGRAREYQVGSRDAANAIRGLSVDLGVFDELRTQIDDTVWAALAPTTVARPDPHILGISTAGNDRSALLRDWFDRGRRVIEGAEPAAGFGMTWYASPDGDDSDAGLIAANPAIVDGRLSLDVLRAAQRSLTPASFRMEHQNLWADAADEWLPAGLWAARVASQPETARGARVTLGVDIVPTWRRASVSVAISTPDHTYVSVAGERVAGRGNVAGSSVSADEVVALLDELLPRWSPALVAVSSSSALAPHVEAWGIRRGVATHALTVRELRHASELLRGELVGHRLTHPDDPLLAKQVRDARPSSDIEGGDWYLSVRQSAGDIDALRAAAWAVWAAIAPPDDVPSGFHL